MKLLVERGITEHICMRWNPVKPWRFSSKIFVELQSELEYYIESSREDDHDINEPKEY